ncbi:C-C motif chemokine 3 [Sarcophilus harrisii]|uniref:C-C motif chemokine n=1 Tax=Sarcophilus harrisii TaxID=9305 RepID=A0A7N4PVP6_SARHA|nr:C-C motif chemokine 3 [Sarcophilus harrisii]
MISLPVLSILLLSTSGLFWGSTADTSQIICCFNYIQRMIPRKVVADYAHTSQLCSSPAIIFITKRGLKVCANPQDKWVQEYVTDLSRGTA